MTKFKTVYRVETKKAEKKMVDMYNAISNGHGEVFASQDDLVKEIREFLKDF